MEHAQFESLEAHLRQLETDLLRPHVRSDPRKLALLLPDEFREFGSSGRIYTKREVVELLPSTPAADISILDFSVTPMAAGIARAVLSGGEARSAAVAVVAEFGIAGSAVPPGNDSK